MGNFIVMTWLLSLGFMPYSLAETKNGSIKAADCMVQTFGTGFYLADHLNIYSTVEIRETKSHSIYFDPFRSDFLIGAAFYFDNLSIGISHECNHDVVTFTDFNKYNGWEAVFDKAYINYTLPLRVNSEITVTPSVTLADQFVEKIQIKSSDQEGYFDYIEMDASPNVLFSELRLEIELPYLRTWAAFQAGLTPGNAEWTHTQFRLGTELFYKNISLGLDYIKRRNMQPDAGYALDGLRLFVRFRGTANLL
jgi:hypothetical protein